MPINHSQPFTEDSTGIINPSDAPITVRDICDRCGVRSLITVGWLTPGNLTSTLVQHQRQMQRSH
ncbi:hypothetical protein NDI37_09795 [Funiculus sociatus GB2-A5]|uniref:Uncharacterized protein n=1 Tax=Funiculus sociatus GB2-A5 TaxID=2933946 RepID=A0ABV0JMU0_9CYAN|nr:MULTISPECIES: hypothetical protein [unclassified Trichocoleus]MBD1907794.1 hypothetical protein [Trichocoleus sp. FACHB-832]MBD2063972.1 hypothetical protein [Trichocoleus sp. FACHB-6]